MILVEKTFKIIRIDGKEETYNRKPTLPEIYRLIRSDTIDTVNIDRENEIVMLVDDTDIIDAKPLNPKATELYHALCRSGVGCGIHGDVAICWDQDFA